MVKNAVFPVRCPMYFLRIFMLFFTLFLIFIKIGFFNFFKNVQKCEKCLKPPLFGGVPPSPQTPPKLYRIHPPVPPQNGRFGGVLEVFKNAQNGNYTAFLAVFHKTSFFCCFSVFLSLLVKTCKISVYGPIELYQKYYIL